MDAWLRAQRSEGSAEADRHGQCRRGCGNLQLLDSSNNWSSETGWSGYEVERFLRTEFRVEDEMADWFNVVYVLSPHDDRQATELSLTTAGGFRLAIRQSARIPRAYLSTGLLDPVVTSIDLLELPTLKQAFEGLWAHLPPAEDEQRSIRTAQALKEVLGDSGPSMALIPGGRNGIDNIKPLAQRLTRAGYRVLIHDRPNCGGSDVAFDASASEDQIAADDLHVLLQQLGMLPAIIGGSSSGARVALSFALRYPENIAVIPPYQLAEGFQVALLGGLNQRQFTGIFSGFLLDGLHAVPTQINLLCLAPQGVLYPKR